MTKDPNAEHTFFIACMVAISLAFFTAMLISNNREWFDKQAGRITVTENEEIKIVNLCVVKKVWMPAPSLISFVGRYYLILSNDMIIDVSMQEFEKYEENQYYDFELMQKTTVSSIPRVSKE